MKDVADDLGVDRSTIARWRIQEDFRALTRKHREALLPDSPSAEATLTQALSATTRAGYPDWPRESQRPRPCSQPLSLTQAREQAARIERIYLAKRTEPRPTE